MKKEHETTAERIAKTLGSDGTVWEKDGKTLDDLCLENGANIERDENEFPKYIFLDGSAIIDTESGWWIEGDEVAK